MVTAVETDFSRLPLDCCSAASRRYWNNEARFPSWLFPMPAYGPLIVMQIYFACVRCVCSCPYGSWNVIASVDNSILKHSEEYVRGSWLESYCSLNRFTKWEQSGLLRLDTYHDWWTPLKALILDKRIKVIWKDLWGRGWTEGRGWELWPGWTLALVAVTFDWPLKLSGANKRVVWERLNEEHTTNCKSSNQILLPSSEYQENL